VYWGNQEGGHAVTLNQRILIMPHYSLKYIFKYIFLATYPLRHTSWLRRFMLVSFLAVLPLWASTTTQAFAEVVAWGRNNQGQTTVPAGLSGVVAIAAGGEHTVALKSDGTVVAWGYNYAGQTTVPAGLSGVVAIAAGAWHTVALKSDGTVVAWGSNSAGQTDSIYRFERGSGDCCGSCAHGGAQERWYGSGLGR
jgi:hypothetical protein